MKNKKIVVIVVSLLISAMLIGCGLILSKDANKMYEYCNSYRKEFLRPDSFYLYDAMKISVKEKNSNKIKKEFWVISFGIENSGGAMRQHEAYIDTTTGKIYSDDDIDEMSFEEQFSCTAWVDYVTYCYDTSAGYSDSYIVKSLNSDEIDAINKKLK